MDLRRLLHFDRGQVKGGAQPAGPSLVQHRLGRRRQKIGARPELFDPLVERDFATTRNKAVAMPLRTFVERAEPSEIAVGSRLDQEHVQLMADDAHAGAHLVSASQRTFSGATQFAEAMLRLDPQRQIEIAALMPDLDAFAPELREPWNFLP